MFNKITVNDVNRLDRLQKAGNSIKTWYDKIKAKGLKEVKILQLSYGSIVWPSSMILICLCTVDFSAVYMPGSILKTNFARHD